MKTRSLGSQGPTVSEVGLGCWQLGADWGEVAEADALEILETAFARGITFFDTADVYGDGRSERLVGRFLDSHQDRVFVATKVGRRNYPGPYTADTLRSHISDSIQRLGVERLDLVQLHCVPSEVLAEGAIFDWLRELKQEGLIRHFGASVESMDEALQILDQPELTSLQIIFNLFRQKPIDALFDRAEAQGVGLIVRLPLASGLLAGKFDADTTFAEDDPRNYNRDGAAFNVGETFAGLPFTTGVRLADGLRPWVPNGVTMAQFAQRWILDHPAVSTVITGASRPDQVIDNAAVSALASLAPETHRQLAEYYAAEVAPHIRGVY
ncbi:aldo/keto reductase [Roseimaritima sediminicola]|uniref:aldo/keto reductase n=1 Tax=Roseimaritima sediminicola TaxID=2662066 RepID=UPI001298327C|nr:aldo/keto reductase [Roseimaritima sediminicola]